MKLTIETAKLMLQSNEESVKRFALDNYPELGKKPLPNSWKEIEEIKGFYIDNDSRIEPIESQTSIDVRNYNISPTKELAEAHLSLIKLMYLRHIYNDGWKADWFSSTPKHCITFKSGVAKVLPYEYTQFALSFKSREIAELFLKTFINDIMIAKQLI